MAVLSDDMGGITAYAAAVNRGYTGTKEEFEQLMYSYTEVAERAEAAAGNAHESEEASIEAKDIAVGAKNEAVSARDAAQSARDSSISAKNDSESARDASISAKNDTLAAKDAVMSAKGSVDETSANFSDEVTAAISDVNAAGRNQKELAKTHAIDSEAWAVGKREGADVGVSDETYHNNSKYYAEQSALAKSETETARDTAITAKNDAVSAKNEAETAKGDAQDIVDGINAKSEQIDQNTSDISELKEDLNATNAEVTDIRVGADGVTYGSAGAAVRGQINAVKKDVDVLTDTTGVYIAPSAKGTTPQNAQANVVLDGLTLISGHSYTYSVAYSSASSAISYVYLADANINVISSKTIQAGTTNAEQTFVATANYENAKILINPARQALNYEVTITDNSIDKTTKIEALETTVGNLAKIIFEENRYIATPSIGTTVNLTSNALNGCACFSIPCLKGDIFTITGTPRDNSGTRPYMWVDSDGKCNYRSEETTVFNAEEIVAPINGTLVVNMLSANTHSAYAGVVDLESHTIKNINDIHDLLNSPIETMPEYFKNTMAYRPLGHLQNPYLCLTCDDGAAELETYTIPMLITKDVPCTFGLMATESPLGEYPVYHNSEVLRTQSGIDAVLNAVENGCEVAQHGALEWTDLTEIKLNTFFDREKAAFDDLGIELKSAICPSHCVNNQVRVIAGGRFGSVRSGYNGFKSNADRIAHISGDVFTPYEYNLTGARSNCYSYTSFNIIDVDINRAKQILDYAIANNMVMIVYWHDNDLNAEQKSVLEAFIDYAKTTTVNFCTLSQIPTLV